MVTINWLNTTGTQAVSVLPVSGAAFGMLACAFSGIDAAGFAGQPTNERHVDSYNKVTSGRRTWSPPIR